MINLRDLLSDYNSRHIAAPARRQRSFSMDIRASSEQPVRGWPSASRLRGGRLAVDIGRCERLPTARAVHNAVDPAGSETSPCVQQLSHHYRSEPLRRSFTLARSSSNHPQGQCTNMRIHSCNLCLWSAFTMKPLLRVASYCYVLAIYICRCIVREHRSEVLLLCCNYHVT